MTVPILTLSLRRKRDVVLARQRGRQVAAMLGYSAHEQTVIATAVFELAAELGRWDGGGSLEFQVSG